MHSYLRLIISASIFVGDMKITDVNAMENWAGSSKKGLTSYRATAPKWLDEAHTQCACGML
jgi:hypothetical protein